MPRPISPPRLPALLLTTLLLAGCNQATNSTTTTTAAETGATTPAVTSTEAADIAPVPQPATAPAPATPAPPLTSPPLQSEVARQDVAGRELIVRVEADFQVPDVVKAAGTIEALTREHQGFVISNIINNEQQGEAQHRSQGGQRLTITSYVRRAELKVRVPTRQLDGFLQELQAQIGFLRSSQFTAQDVAFDIQKTALEEELNRLRSGALGEQVRQAGTAQAQAGNISAIEKQYLAEREAQYADLAERQLRDQVEYSLVRLTFDQPAQTHQVTSEDLSAVIRQHTPPFSQRLAASLGEGWSNLTEFVLALARGWPFLLGLGLVAASWLRLNRRRTEGRERPAPSTPPSSDQP